MSEFVRACRAADVAPESAIPVEIGGTELAIVHSDGQFYAIADECSHASIPLSEGDVGDGEIECYLHGPRFDLVPASRPGCRPPSPWRSIAAQCKATMCSSTSPHQLSPGGTTPPTPRYKPCFLAPKPRTPRSLDPLMSTLEIRDLHVSVDTEAGSKPILKGVDLTIRSGETHAIMGPNGSGKSTLAYSIAGHPKYKITSGSVTLDGTDLLSLTVDQRARAGLFLAMQYPVEVPGVSVSNFLRTAKTALDGEAPKLRTWVKEGQQAMDRVKMDPDMASRSVNEGFSGGEEEATRDRSAGAA